MKHLIPTIAIILCSLSVVAQQEAMYTHYAFNTLMVNPAYAGSREALTLTALHRSQWVGFKGAPHTQTITAHAPFRDNDMGLGISIMNDKIGPVNNTGFFADYAYKIPFHNGRLSMALKGGIDLVQIDLNALYAHDQSDVLIANNVRNEVLPNFGVGLYYSEENYYVGLSTPRIINNKLNIVNSSSSQARVQQHYYLIGGTMLSVLPNLQFKPMGLLKLTSSAPAELDITGIAVLDQKFEIGAMYRTRDAFGVLFGINFDSNLRLGYSFDWSFGLNTGKYNGGSHEIILRYDFIQNDRRKIVSPRYF
jgi:type IX secretion system PorP/SprF family membrane protein